MANACVANAGRFLTRPTFSSASQTGIKTAYGLEVSSVTAKSLTRSQLNSSNGLRVTTVSSIQSVARGFAARASAAETGNAIAAEDLYEVEVDKPYGLKFYKGEGGATYIEAISPGSSADLTGLIEEGDKVLETSAVFGDELWPAAEYSRTLYTIKNRIGPLRIKLQKMNGVRVPEFKDAYIEERNAGNIGDNIREKQVENYIKRVQLERERREESDEALSLYKKGEFNKALERFERILGLLPEYNEAAITLYNIACCRSKLGQVKEGLKALEDAMEAGFEDYKKIRQDPDLATIRNTDEFDDLINKYDESFINENALKAITSVFGLFGKK